MKKTILFTLCLLTAIFASAQTIGPRSEQQAKLRRPVEKTATMAPKPLDIHHLDVTARKAVCAAPVTPRRVAKAPALLDTYHVAAVEEMGNSDRTKSKVNWDMHVQQNADGTLTLHNFLPLPDLFKNLVTGVSVTGRLVGNQIVINPTKTMISTGAIDVWIANNAGNANGIIKIDVDANGGLKLETGTVLAYLGVTAGSDFVLTGANKTVQGFFFNYNNALYSTDVKAQFVPKGMILNSTLDFMGNARNRNGGIIPPFIPLTFENTSLNADSYEWKVDEVILNFYTGLYDYVSASFEGTDRDFTFTPNGNFSTYTPVQLKANGRGSSTYTYGKQYGGVDGTGLSKEVVFIAGELSDRYALETGETPIMSVMNPDLGFATIADFGTPTYAKQNITDLIMYQGCPEAPLYCEGINIMLYNFEKYANFRLTCGLYRAHRQSDGFITLGEKIAESKKTTESTSGAAGKTITELRFTDFTLYKADGTSRKVDHLFLEDEFAIVISGWDNRTFSAVPFGELNQEEGALTSTFFRLQGDDKIYKYENTTQRLCVGFYYSGYGHLHSSAATDVIEFPAEGGGMAVLIDPLFANNDGSPRIFRDTEEYPIPSWIEMGVLPMEEGEESGDDVGSDDSFLLAFIADPLPEGVESRSAEMELWQEGAKIHFTLTQSKENVNAINAPLLTPEPSASAFNLQGIRVSPKTKGIQIINGRKRLVK